MPVAQEHALHGRDLGDVVVHEQDPARQALRLWIGAPIGRKRWGEVTLPPVTVMWCGNPPPAPPRAPKVQTAAERGERPVSLAPPRPRIGAGLAPAWRVPGRGDSYGGSLVAPHSIEYGSTSKRTSAPPGGAEVRFDVDPYSML